MLIFFVYSFLLPYVWMNESLTLLPIDFNVMEPVSHNLNH